MQGKATFRGHPLHLMLIPFPVAFWSGALFTDSAGALTHDAFWFRMSAVLIAMGTVGAVLASVAGFVDYRTAVMSRRAHGIATGHMLWSLATLAAFALAWFLRGAFYAAPAGVVATVAGAALLFVAGYLGSELANRYRVGISDSPEGDVAAGVRAKRRR
ncbi:MAG: DUF2231 domain-containing protein [Candidatus Eremiobacteraeota bacterium]|nr:DUF2231 domain-containing protein [Candidatus Eremiobacteraeota bacterium]